MPVTPALLPELIAAVSETINQHADEVTALDQAIGDGDHVTNLQRGLLALSAQSAELAQLDWPAAWQKIGMTLMSTVGGASGSLYGTLFIALSKASREHAFADAFMLGVEAMKQRGKADVGEKTMLDVLIPVAQHLQQATHENKPLNVILSEIQTVALAGMEATREMLATKGRASFLGERSLGHIDAGAKTAQLIITALLAHLPAQF